MASRRDSWPTGETHGKQERLMTSRRDSWPAGETHGQQERLLASRRDSWPEETPLREKLKGDLRALQRTACFVRTTGVSI